jgi:hypothetical protein
MTLMSFLLAPSFFAPPHTKQVGSGAKAICKKTEFIRVRKFC